jgi:hypothetical protein
MRQITEVVSVIHRRSIGFKRATRRRERTEFRALAPEDDKLSGRASDLEVSDLTYSAT